MNNNNNWFPTRDLFLVSIKTTFFAGSVFLLSACSYLSNERAAVVNDSTPQQQWYECGTGADGLGWDCGKGRSQSGVPGAETEESDTQWSNMSDGSAQQRSTELHTTQSDDQTDNVPDSGNPTVADEQIRAEALSSIPIYTIQLGAFAGEAKRDAFVVENSLQNLSLNFYESSKDGRTWWVLTYGDFMTAQEAREEAANLAAEYDLNDTWIRPLAQLKPQSDDEVNKQSASEIPVGAEERGESAEMATHDAEMVADEDVYNPRYSIQLAAFQAEAKRRSFLESKGLTESQVTLTQEERVGMSWWLVLYGEFETVAEAKIEQVEIETEFDLSGTWIKPVY